MSVLRDTLVDFACLAAEPRSPEETLARSGVRAADGEFAALYAQHGGRIHRVLSDRLGDRALAADATQETFVRAFRNREVFDGGRAIAPWLFGIARNVSLEMRRARHRARRVITPTNSRSSRDAPEPRVAGSPESELLGREALRVVGAAVERLSEERRAMLLLRLDHSLAYEEIAALMGFSVAKVKVEIFRAREVLRETMAEYERGAK